MPEGHGDLRKVPYQRPTQPWVCGHQAEGRPCRLGPDDRGLCLATTECRPVKRGDRWECTRAQAAGGPCSSGPCPDGACAIPIARCAPARSTAAKRALTTRWVFVAAVAVLALGLSTRWRQTFLAPGDLSVGHALLLSRRDPGCAACHASAAGIGAAKATSTTSGQSGSEMCLVCHDPVVGGPAALRAHGLPPEQLALVTARLQVDESPRPIRATLAALAPAAASSEGIACATCHREHRGTAHRLTEMSAAACQSCHTAPFANFALGHPEFPDGPTSAAIAFDHAGHQATHFKSAPFACEGCHSGTGERMATASFERTCASCHDQGSVDHHGDEIRKARMVVLQLPDMPHGTPRWVARAGVQDSALTPLMRLLLAGEPDGERLDAALAFYRAHGDQGVPVDWEGSEPQRAALADALVAIVREVAMGDTSGLRARVARALDSTPEDSEVARLVDELATARLAALLFQRRWLPQAATGTVAAVASAASGDQVPAGAPGLVENARDATDQDALLRAASGRWTIAAGDPGIVYQPTSHADALPRTLADALAAHAALPSKAAEVTDATSFRRHTRSAVFEELTSRQGGFLYAACVKCHQVEPSGGSFRVRWRSSERTTASRLTSFNHAVHTRTQGEAGRCAACHLTGASSAVPATEPVLPVMGLQPVRRAVCVTCHSPGRAPVECLTCHKYHSGAANSAPRAPVRSTSRERVSQRAAP